jgi:DHA1 family tetracycline resistance protein-like MFS transporter
MEKKPPRFALFTLFWVVATELIGFGLIIPVLPQIAARYQPNPYLLGFLLASYSLCQFFSAPILGRLSDKYGRKPVLLVSKMGTCISYLIFAFSGTYWLILLSRMLDGFTGGNISVARAYVADVTTDEHRSRGMAVIGMAFGFGFLLGPAMGGFLYHVGSGHRAAGLVAAFLSFLAWVLTVVFLKEPVHHVKAERGSFWKGLRDISSSPAIVSVLLIQIVYMMVFSGFETTFSVFTATRFSFTETQNSWTFFYIGILALLFQGMLSRVTVSSVKKVVPIGLALAGLAFLCLAFSQTVFFLLVALAILAVGVGLVNVFLPALLSKMALSEERGQTMGVYEGVGSLARILGPLIAFASVYYHFTAGYFAFGVLLVLLCMWTFRRFYFSRRPL